MVDVAIDLLLDDYGGFISPKSIQATIEAAIEASWNRFDVDDKSTWPELDQLVLTNQGLPAAFNDKYTWYLEYYQLDDQNVTYWMPLPEYKG
jgi:hypothetical protein